MNGIVLQLNGQFSQGSAATDMSGVGRLKSSSLAFFVVHL